MDNPWLRTLEDGLHAADIFSPKRSRAKFGTRAFARAVIDRLRLLPRCLTPASGR